MRKALLFENIADFVDFVRLRGLRSRSKKGFELYQVQIPERKTSDALVLVGFRGTKQATPLSENYVLPTSIEVTIDAEYLLWHQGNREKKQLRILSKKMAHHLAELIQLQPWKKEPVPLKRVVFWLKDHELLGQLVNDSLKLGNDRIQYAPVSAMPPELSEEGLQSYHGGDGAVDTADAILLRIETPSYYLLQWYQEKYADVIQLYYPIFETLYVQWGFQHALQELWKRESKTSQQGFYFLNQENVDVHIRELQWRDVYEATEFIFDFPTAKSWVQDNQQTLKFQIPLQLVVKNRPEEPEFWCLTEEEKPHLEHLLSVLDQEDLEKILLSIQESNNGKKYYFLRERRTGEGRPYLDFGGQRFAAYKGFHNLLLPTDQELQPQIRREQYRTLFQLQAGQLTFLIPQLDPDSEEEGFHLLRLSESGFEPLTHFVEHELKAEEEYLKKLLLKSIFDLGPYAEALSRPDLLHAQKQANQKGKKPTVEKRDPRQRPEGEEDEEFGAVEHLKKKKSKGRNKAKKANDEPLRNQVRLSELEKQEAVVERALIQKGQEPQRWLELYDLKVQQQKWYEACECAIEALWLHPHDPDSELIGDLCKLLENFYGLKGSLNQRQQQALKLSKSDESIRACLAFVLYGRELTDSRVDNWLQQASQVMRNCEDKLRKKERWLMWAEIVRCNGDQREEARIREDLLAELNERGLTPSDTPMFIQNRLLQERGLQVEGSTESESNEIGAALFNLDTLTEYLEKFPLKTFKQVGYAIVAHAFTKLGVHTRGETLMQQALKKSGDLPHALEAVIYTFYIDLLRKDRDPRQQEMEKYYKNLLKNCKDATTKTLKTLKESLESRDTIENPAEFLSQDNVKRFFLQQSTSERQKHKNKLMQINECYKRGEFEQIVVKVEELFIDAKALLDSGKPSDLPEIARLLYGVVEILGKMQGGRHEAKLQASLEDFVETTDQKTFAEDQKITHFYFLLMRASLAQGLMELGKEQEAITIVENVLQWCSKNDLVPLDFVDMSAVILNALEGAQLHNRRRGLSLFMECFLKQTTGKSNIFNVQFNQPNFALFVMRLFDQATAAALSKDKMAIGLYRHYMNQDELLIRERIITEPLCE